MRIRSVDEVPLARNDLVFRESRAWHVYGACWFVLVLVGYILIRSQFQDIWTTAILLVFFPIPVALYLLTTAGKYRRWLVRITPQSILVKLRFGRRPWLERRDLKVLEVLFPEIAWAREVQAPGSGLELQLIPPSQRGGPGSVADLEALLPRSRKPEEAWKASWTIVEAEGNGRLLIPWWASGVRLAPSIARALEALTGRVRILPSPGASESEPPAAAIG